MIWAAVLLIRSCVYVQRVSQRHAGKQRRSYRDELASDMEDEPEESEPEEPDEAELDDDGLPINEDRRFGEHHVNSQGVKLACVRSVICTSDPYCCSKSLWLMHPPLLAAFLTMLIWQFLIISGAAFYG